MQAFDVKNPASLGSGGRVDLLVSPKKPRPRDLSDRDQSDLCWFFGPGQTVFEKSCMGPMIERAQLFAFGTRRCDECEGSGFWNERREADRARRGTLREHETRRRSRLGRAEELAALILESSGDDAAVDAPKRPDDLACPECKGMGWKASKSALRNRRDPTDKRKVAHGVTLERLDARPKSGSGHEEPSYTPEDAHLRRYARISKRLMLVQRVDGESAAVLSVYYGDRGSRWRPTRGRIFALYPMTDEGTELVRRSRLRAGKDAPHLAPDETIESEVVLQRTAPKEGRRAVLNRIDDAARAMYDRARDAWWGTIDPRGAIVTTGVEAK